MYIWKEDIFLFRFSPWGITIKKLRNHFTDKELVIFVIPTGEMSNFLEEDFDALLNVIQAENQKRKL